MTGIQSSGLYLRSSVLAFMALLSLLSFRFAEPEGLSATAPLQVQSDIDNCRTGAYEYFYTSSERYRMHADSLYARIFSEGNRPDKKVFQYALKGYAALLSQQKVLKQNILAFIDYSVSANKKRFWVVDLHNFQVLYHELVAHGRNSGEEFARRFSNLENSFQSSMGFFITGEIYKGKHDLSVKLNGMENRFNGRAFERGIVIHGADYVSESFIRHNKRLGRSLGCPAVSEKVIRSLSETISDGAVVFSYYPNSSYLKSSKILNTDAVFAAPAKI